MAGGRGRRGDTARSGRREELLGIAAGLFARDGLRATTVRDIADAAGILSGSLYHHFDSKETIVDEILRGFLDDLFAAYDEVARAGLDARATLEGLVRASFAAIGGRHDEVAIYQDEAKHLRANPRFEYISARHAEFREMWLAVLRRGVEEGDFRADLDLTLAYRFLRDTVWVAVRWYRADGELAPDVVADQYLSIVLDGIAVDHPARSNS